MRCMNRYALEKHHQGPREASDHVTTHGCESRQGVRGPCAKVQCGRSPDHQESQRPAVSLPAPRLAPSWVAMQKLSLSQATSTPSSCRRPRDPSGAERRTSAKCPPSPHPISWPPPAAEAALPNQEPGLPHRPPSPYWWRVNLPVLPRDWAARTLPPIPSKCGHLPRQPAPLPRRASPTRARPHIHQTAPSPGVHHSREEK